MASKNGREQRIQYYLKIPSGISASIPQFSTNLFLLRRGKKKKQNRFKLIEDIVFYKFMHVFSYSGPYMFDF